MPAGQIRFARGCLVCLPGRCQLMDLQPPHLLFLGDVVNPLDAKTAMGVLDWRPEDCIGQFRLPGCGVDLGLPELTPEAAVALGAKSLLLGVAPLGGDLASPWVASIRAALESGLSVVSGLHQRLADIPELQLAAEATGVALVDVRVPPRDIGIGSGRKRSGNRLLTVGTDCCVGKKYTALAVARALTDAGVDATFRATGQTGIMIAGSGIPVDGVVADFLSGACEQLTPDADADHWDVIEGQGSLFHPAYAAVTLGLVHGSQPDAMLLCHEPGRLTIDEFDDFAIPELQTCIQRYEAAARLTNPAARVVGISLLTKALEDGAALEVCADTSHQTGLPCFDPLRHPMDGLLVELAGRGPPL